MREDCHGNWTSHYLDRLVGIMLGMSWCRNLNWQLIIFNLLQCLIVKMHLHMFKLLWFLSKPNSPKELINEGYILSHLIIRNKLRGSFEDDDSCTFLETLSSEESTLRCKHLRLLKHTCMHFYCKDVFRMRCFENYQIFLLTHILKNKLNSEGYASKL